jgi:hypothetical protein
MLSAKVLVLAFALAVFGVFAAIISTPRVDLPAHVLHNTVIPIPDMLSASVAESLMQLSKEMRDFPTNVADLKFYKTQHEHIGEAQPVGANGKCSHPYLVPSSDKKLCVFPGRIDVARHFLLGGGVEGLKEPFDDAASRLQSFGRYMFNVSQYAAIEQLFASESFQLSAKSVCPQHKQFLDPFQFNFIVQLPGQTVALHLDAPYFWGATRFQFPQWLLASMVFSNLFAEHFVDQVQVVGYYHRWNDTHVRSGDFVYWDENRQEPKRMPAHSLAGNVVDGSKTVHAASIYHPERKAPLLDKSADSMLSYVGNDKWELRSNNQLLHTYDTDDLRMTIVYRARCFANADEAHRFNNLPPDQYLKLDYILDTFRADLVKRGRLTAAQAADNSDPMALPLMILNEYVKYPLVAQSTSLIPFNYCALSNILPWTKPILQLFC